MRKYNKVLVVIISLITIMSLATTLVNAIDYSSPEYLKGQTNDSGVDTSTLETQAKVVLGAIQVVGTIAAVGIIMVIGIRYMMGSAEEKAAYKKTMIPYVIGAVLLFSATTIANMVYNIAIHIK